jgi:Holliday junction resolvase-like predicted endonuclease
MVDDEKQRRIRWAADAWLARHPETAGLEVSFDVIALRSGRLERVAEAF